MPTPPKTKPKPVRQCEYAMHSSQQERCPNPATCKWGDNWFCDNHGSRITTDEIVDSFLKQGDDRAVALAGPQIKGVICAHGGCC